MYEQDYIMRIIKEMVRAILKLLFNIDTDSPTTELLQDAEDKANVESLLYMIDEGRINEAENALYELIEDRNHNNPEAALLFYSYLNEKTDDFLEEHNFTRDEIIQGLKDILSGFGMDNIAEMFLR